MCCEYYGGGVVFYVYDNGLHGLIASKINQSTGIRWFGGSNTTTRAKADGIGAGLKNSYIVIANQGSVDGNDFAATACNEYSITESNVNYGSWYLPSKYELNLLYLQSATVSSVSQANGGNALLTNASYWSSTEATSTQAYQQHFGTGTPNQNTKDASNSVRAIRTF